MIVLNSPHPGRYDKVMGQVDIYPTILDLAGITAPGIPGLGISALSPDAPGAAIGITGHIAGDTTAISPETLRHLQSSYPVSSTIIRANLLHHN